MFIYRILSLLVILSQFLTFGDSNLRINMDKVVTSKEDAYVCTHTKLTSEIYPIGFVPRAKASTAHHMMLYACMYPALGGGENCHTTCSGISKILYAWARNAPPLHLPKNVSFDLGGRTGFKYLVLQMHYKIRVTTPDSSGLTILTSPTPLPRVAGVMLMAANVATIPPHKKKVIIPIACQLSTRTKVSPFAFRTHAHSLARTNFAYWFPSDTQHYLIGRASPQWPQAFYPTSSHGPLVGGDRLVGACVYDSMMRNSVTHFGDTHLDEMCNVYIMYSRDRKSDPLTEAEEMVCADGVSLPMEEAMRLWHTLPSSAFDYLPTSMPPNYFKNGKSNLVSKSMFESEIPGTTKVKNVSHLKMEPTSFRVNNTLGQVSGVAFDSAGRLFVFHRAGRVWDDNTFDYNNRFINAKQRGPIRDPTILIVNRTSGHVIKRFGANFFFMPHGISIDAHDNVWVTDVALHQAFRFDRGNFSAPSLTVGTRLEPGSGPHHMCKPTDVAALPNGSFYVADGYCNSRIAAFSRVGKFLKSIHSALGKMKIPHSLTFIENRSQLCCADREHARIECFNLDGKSVRVMQGLSALGTAVYAICEAPELTDGKTPALHGVGLHDDGPQGFSLLLSNTPRVLARWGPKMGRPHDVAVYNAHLYVAQIDPPFRVSSFVERHTKVESPLQLSSNSTVIRASSTSDIWSLFQENLTFLLGVLIAVPLLTVLIGACLARIHRNGWSLHRPKVYSERDRAKFKALINQDSESEDELTLNENLGVYGQQPLPKKT